MFGILLLHLPRARIPKLGFSGRSYFGFSIGGMGLFTGSLGLGLLVRGNDMTVLLIVVFLYQRV